MTATEKTPESEEEKKTRIPKTVRVRRIKIDDEAYLRCPYSGCDYKVKDKDYWINHNGPQDEIDGHVRQVHGFVWMRTGKTAGWWPVSKIERMRQSGLEWRQRTGYEI
jgi:hypothetical protein